MSDQPPVKSINSLKGPRCALYFFLAFILLMGVLTEVPYAFFQWDILSRVLMIMKFDRFSARNVFAPLLVPFDTFIQMFLLTPISSAREAALMSLDHLSLPQLMVFLFANAWFFTNFLSEAIGIASVVEASAPRKVLMWLDFPFAIGSYNLLFTQFVFDGIDSFFNQKLPVKLFNKSPLLFFHASLMLLASIADWSIAAFYTGRRAAGEVLGHEEWGNGLGIVSALLSIIFMTLSQLPETFNYVYQPIENNQQATDEGLTSYQQQRYKIPAIFWGILRASCLGFLLTNSLINLSMGTFSPIILSVVSSLFALTVASGVGCLTYRAAYQQFLNEHAKSCQASLSAGNTSQELMRFKYFLGVALVISMFQRRLQAVEFNTTTFAKDIGGQANAIAWMLWLLPEQAISYGLFLWKHITNVAEKRYDQLRGLGSFCCSFTAGDGLEEQALLQATGASIQCP